MTGLDTNVLVRYLTRDDPKQFRKAEGLLARISTAGETAHISVIVMCELVWVLERGYRFRKEELVVVLRNLLDTAELSIEDRDYVAEAVDEYESGKAGFSDCLIGIRNRAAGCAETVTFDSALRSARSFRVL